MFSCLKNFQILERAKGKVFSWLSDLDVKRSVRQNINMADNL